VPSAAIYLDNHATTRVDPRVLQAMLPWFSERYGNAASISHGFGHEAADAVHAARETIVAALHCPPESLIFTSGATESNNLAIKGVLAARGTDAHLVVNAAEHRAVLDPAKRLRRAGHPVTIVPVDAHGRVDPQRVEDALQPSTRLVSVMLSNNEVGTVNPVAEFGALCRERGVAFHCDASQAVGRIPVDLAQLPIDLLSFTAHKLYGPKGVGALYVRRGSPRIPLTPQIDGGGHEGGLRSGTLPVPLIVGFAEAMRLAAEQLEPESRRVGALRARLQHALCSQLDGLTIHGHPTERLPGNLNVGFDGVDGEALMVGVAQRGLAVSSGSACTSADPEPSHVLRAMGVPEGLARASLRFGLGRFNTADEVDQAAQIVVEAVRQLRDRQ
jgi:cysteine desulfurase